MANPQPDQFIQFSTELFEALCRIRIPGEARQIFDIIIRKTYGWKKPSDRISLTQFQEISGMKRASVVRAIRTLKAMNLITVKSSQSGSIYKIIKDYHAWVVAKRLPVVVAKRLPKVVAKRLHTIDKKDTIKDKRQASPVLKDVYKVKEQPFPPPTDDQKEEMKPLAGKLLMLSNKKFNVYNFIAKVNKTRGYFPPFDSMIKIANAAIKTNPANLWGYFAKALSSEIPKHFAGLAIQEHQQMKQDLSAEKAGDFLKRVYGG